MTLSIESSRLQEMRLATQVCEQLMQQRQELRASHVPEDTQLNDRIQTLYKRIREPGTDLLNATISAMQFQATRVPPKPEDLTAATIDESSETESQIASNPPVTPPSNQKPSGLLQLQKKHNHLTQERDELRALYIPPGETRAKLSHLSEEILVLYKNKIHALNQQISQLNKDIKALGGEVPPKATKNQPLEALTKLMTLVQQKKDLQAAPTPASTTKVKLSNAEYTSKRKSLECKIRTLQRRLGLRAQTPRVSKSSRDSIEAPPARREQEELVDSSNSDDFSTPSIVPRHKRAGDLIEETPSAKRRAVDRRDEIHQ